MRVRRRLASSTNAALALLIYTAAAAGPVYRPGKLKDAVLAEVNVDEELRKLETPKPE